jgi:hypothetical protein
MKENQKKKRELGQHKQQPWWTPVMPIIGGF